MGDEASGSAPTPSGTVTFLLTDLEGSTRLWEEHPESMKVAVVAHDEILRNAIESHGGHIFSTAGDAFAAAFSRPEQALLATVEAQGALAAHEWPERCELKARMGVHSGVAQEREGDYFGPAVNRTARLMGAGHGGQILVSLATEEILRDQLPQGVVLQDLGRHRLRDLSHPEHLFQAGDEEFPPLRTLEAVPNNLPAQLSSFIGREDELRELGQLLEAHRLVTLTGVGGTGKTRLALQLAADLLDRFPDGVYLVELAQVTDPTLVTEQIAAVIKASPQGAQEARSDMERLSAYLLDQQMLLILDNCEHVIEAVAQIAEQLLRECPQVFILATSREALEVDGERALRIPSLQVPPEDRDLSTEELLRYDSVVLLVDRARGPDPHFQVSEEHAGALGEICRRFDGIPLALELAARRVVSLSAGEVAKLLDDQFLRLTGGRRTAVERHRTMQAAIDWSYELLSDDAKRLLPRLSVFSGGWALDAAKAVGADEALKSLAVVDALSELVEKSMVVVEHGEAGSRYRMVEPIRQYALEKLTASGQMEKTRDRHAAWIVERFGARSYRDSIERLNDPSMLLLGLTEYANLVEAMRWLLERGAGDTVACLLPTTYPSFFTTGRHREGLQLTGAALAHHGVSCWARYFAQLISGYFSLFLGDFEGARARVEEAAAVGERCPEVTSLYRVHLVRATIASFTGALGAHRDQLRVTREEAGAAGDLYLALYATFLLGWAAGFEGDYEVAIALVEEAYEPVKFLPIGWVPYVPAVIAYCKVLAGHGDAEAAIEEAGRVARSSGDPQAIGWALMAPAAAGPVERSRAAVEESSQLWRRHGLLPLPLLQAAAHYGQHRDDPPGAARALGALSTYLEDVTAIALWERLLAWARGRLGEKGFRQHFEAGARESPESVIEGMLEPEPPQRERSGGS